MEAQKSARQIMVRRRRIAVFGHDPRIYQTTVLKEFLKDKNGNLCGLADGEIREQKDEKT